MPSIATTATPLLDPLFAKHNIPSVSDIVKEIKGWGETIGTIWNNVLSSKYDWKTKLSSVCSFRQTNLSREELMTLRKDLLAGIDGKRVDWKGEGMITSNSPTFDRSQFISDESFARDEVVRELFEYSMYDPFRIMIAGDGKDAILFELPILAGIRKTTCFGSTDGSCPTPKQAQWRCDRCLVVSYCHSCYVTHHMNKKQMTKIQMQHSQYCLAGEKTEASCKTVEAALKKLNYGPLELVCHEDKNNGGFTPVWFSNVESIGFRPLIPDKKVSSLPTTATATSVPPMGTVSMMSFKPTATAKTTMAMPVKKSVTATAAAFTTNTNKSKQGSFNPAVATTTIPKAMDMSSN
jgi:hypothetical protein